MAILFTKLLATTFLSLLVAAAQATAQPKGKVWQYSDVTVEGSILEPEKIEVSYDKELASLINTSDGFQVQVFARNLVNPRMLAISKDGTLYATRRSVGDVIMLKDENNDGKADNVQTVASRAGMHGIAFDGNQVFLVTVNDVYGADVNANGTFGEIKRIINDLPDGGQHPNRTIASWA
jgi:glucose/arabinose dehydrogenase